MDHRKRFPELEAVAGRGRPGAPGALRFDGVFSVKLELWNSRSSWRSVWPRSPYSCLRQYGEIRNQNVELRKDAYLVIHVYDRIVASS